MEARAAVMESSTTSAEWKLEVERVLPQLKVQLRTETKDWRNHLSEMLTNKSEIEGALKHTNVCRQCSDLTDKADILITQGQLSKLQENVSKVLEKIESRERYINTQLDGLIREYRSAQDGFVASSNK